MIFCWFRKTADMINHKSRSKSLVNLSPAPGAPAHAAGVLCHQALNRHAFLGPFGLRIRTKWNPWSSWSSS